jgi:predicted Zn-dependent protease with MMP-like domain
LPFLGSCRARRVAKIGTAMRRARAQRPNLLHVSTDRRRPGPANSGPRRDRHGRGLRRSLTPRGLPRTRSQSERFDDLVLDAISELELHWAAEMVGIEFAVEDVPAVGPGDVDDFSHDLVLDRGVPLGRLLRTETSAEPAPTIVVYRRPVEARASDRDDRGDLVFMIVAELVAELLGRDVDEIDPPGR